MFINKKIGTDFEHRMCELLALEGWWVHFISPDARGAQPFDIIAVKNDVPMAVDCKTCVDHIFRLTRLEDNQILAFDKWIACGNTLAYLSVLHNDAIYMISYKDLATSEKIDLDKLCPTYQKEKGALCMQK